MPDVSDALFKVLAKVYARDGAAEVVGTGASAAAGGSAAASSKKRALGSEGGLGSWWPAKRNLMAKVLKNYG